MSSSQQLEAPPFASPPRAAPPSRRIVIPLHRVLGFARQGSGAHPSRQLAFALRPLLSLALATTGLCPEMPVAELLLSSRTGRGRAAPPLGAGGGGSADGGAGSTGTDPELLFSALTSLVEVVKTLTPGSGRVYAHLGHQAVPAPAEGDPADDADGADPEPYGDGQPERAAGATPGAPRSEVVIELVSTASASCTTLPPAIRGDFGGLAYELAVVGAIVESKGGEMNLGTPHGDSRSFVVRLPVCRC